MFKKCAQKGFTLKNLYDRLGESKVIHTTLVREEEEDDFLLPSTLYVNNRIVDGWNKIITECGSILWDDMFRSLPYLLIDHTCEDAANEEAPTEDAAYEEALTKDAVDEEAPTEDEGPTVTPQAEPQVKTATARKARKAQPTVESPSDHPHFQLLQQAINRLAKKMEDGFAAMNIKVDELSTRLKDVEEKQAYEIFEDNQVFERNEDDESGKEEA